MELRSHKKLDSTDFNDMENKTNIISNEELHEEISLIPIKTDGNCLFRCIATCLSSDLYNCKRTKFGIPTNKKYQSQELAYSRTLRFLVTNYVGRNIDMYKDDIYYDSELYENIDDRMKHMKLAGEFGGMLELTILSKLLEININVYVNNDDKPNLIFSFRKNFKKSCNLLLENDHYEVLTNKLILDTNNSESEDIIDELVTNSDKSSKVVPGKDSYENTTLYYPNFTRTEIKCVPFICKNIKTTKGILVQNYNKYESELEQLAEGNKGKKIELGWFFWENQDEVSKWAIKRNILWLL